VKAVSKERFKMLLFKMRKKLMCWQNCYMLTFLRIIKMTFVTFFYSQTVRNILQLL